MTAKFTVGQKLLWYNNNDCVRVVTVEKVSSKWITLEGGLRMLGATMEIEDDYWSGRCYFSHEEWKSDKALKAAWSSLPFQISRSLTPPPNVSLADIKAAAAMLGLKIED